MSLWKKKELLEALSGEILDYYLTDSLEIDEVAIDGRKAIKKTLFIALKGENHDAHDFLKQAADSGCNCFLIHDAKNLSQVKNPNFILVKNTFVALYKIAEYSRKRSSAKIIAVTGSVGKTSVKEMLKNAFATQGKTFATTGNLNNHIGLPLTLSNFHRDCEYGIFEMGMNHLGEIDPLSKLTRPHLSVITTVGPVHIEFFQNEEEIALAKSEIFSGLVKDGIALINHDNYHFEFLKKRAKYYEIKDENIISFGQKNISDYQILNVKIKNHQLAEVEARLKNDLKITYQIGSSHLATIFNSIIIIAALDLLGKNLNDGLVALEELEIPDGRGKAFVIKIDGKNVIVIDDTYNASVLSMKAGIDHAMNLKKILGKKRVVAALGDMLELGEKSVELHEEVIEHLKNSHADFAVLVGKEMTRAAKILPANSCKAFPDSAAASLEIKGLLNDGDILYLKGSRGTKMEKIIEQLTNTKSAH
jgi:UDP-N-acetylmuramoyl-tripeptide--D-alanyl-D-alanine ligase